MEVLLVGGGITMIVLSGVFARAARDRPENRWVRERFHIPEWFQYGWNRIIMCLIGVVWVLGGLGVIPIGR